MVCLYDKAETNFDHNGLCVLDPSVCDISEEAGGSYELYMEHPFDAHGKFMLLAEEMLIKAPVPHTEIPEITLPEKTTYTVSRVATFYRQMPMPKYKKAERSALTAVRANPQAYAYSSGRAYNSGAYCVYGPSIYVATGASIGETPGTGGSWNWMALVNGGGSGGGDSDYTPGETWNPGLELGQTVTKLGEFTDTVYQVRDQFGRIGYYQKNDLTIETTAPEIVPPQTIDTQIFRIYNVESEEETGVLQVYARHISYDFAGNKIMSCNLVESEVNNAIAVMQGNLMIADSRRIACQFEGNTITRDWSFKNPVNALLDPDLGLVPELNARLIRNNEDFYILKNDNPRTGPRLEYGINLKGVKWGRNVETVITRVVPRCKTGQDDHLYLEHGGTWVNGEWVQNNDIYVESPIKDDYAFQRIEVMDCGYSVGEKYTPAGSSVQRERTEASCREDMLKDAQKRFTDDHCDGPEITLSVDFLLIGDTEQFKQYKGLQRVNLYDMIPIKTRTYEARAQVTAYTYDSLRGRYKSVEVGNVSNFANRVAGFQVVNESITYAKLAPELISMIRTMGAPSGDSTGTGGGGAVPSSGEVIATEVIDNLNSTSATAALSANQGKVLKEKTDPVDKTANVTFNTTYVYSSANFKVYKIGRVAYITGYIQFASGTAVPVDTTILTLPADCKPIEEWTLIAQRPTTNDANQARVMIVKTTGAIPRHNGDSITGGFLRFTGSFITAE